jgi:hypothetical protein
VLYRAPGWFLEPLIHHFFVGPELRKIFDFREARMGEIFAAETNMRQGEALAQQ